MVAVKPESRETIKNWLPGSNAEDYVVSADIVAFKPEATSGEESKPAAAAAAERSQTESQPGDEVGC